MKRTQELRRLFAALDEDESGDVGVGELTAFVWGRKAALAADTQQQSSSDVGGVLTLELGKKTQLFLRHCILEMII